MLEQHRKQNKNIHYTVINITNHIQIINIQSMEIIINIQNIIIIKNLMENIISMGSHLMLLIKQHHIKEVKYSGKVYSVEVYNGFYVSRRNGKISIHHNSEGSKTTRATAQEMSLPTLKKLKSRQRLFKFYIQHMINFVIDQKIIAKQISPDINRKFRIIPSPIVSRDNKGVAQAVSGLVDGLIKAADRKWIDDKKAKNVIGALISQLGVDMDSDMDTDPSEGIEPEEDGIQQEK